MGRADDMTDCFVFDCFRRLLKFRQQFLRFLIHNYYKSKKWRLPLLLVVVQFNPFVTFKRLSLKRSLQKLVKLETFYGSFVMTKNVFPVGSIKIRLSSVHRVCMLGTVNSTRWHYSCISCFKCSNYIKMLVIRSFVFNYRFQK